MQYLLVCDIKTCQIIGSITKEVQQDIARSGYNFWDSFIAILLRNNKTAERERQCFTLIMYSSGLLNMVHLLYTHFRGMCKTTEIEETNKMILPRGG